MSVVVDHITKIYGTQKAVDNISFEAGKGQILGLLGPNGAGKTTTMKMLTCFLPPNEGTAKVCGYDIIKDHLDVRRCIGYLPEHNPLYHDMYVKEFLTTVASVYKVNNKESRIKDIIEMTGLGHEQHKNIGALSKGYRQRVGLAQALIHDPEVLILDEPTSGLDPNQLAEIRQLIIQLGKEKTVIFSSHILQEVKALCDRVVILNHGEIVANDVIANLASQSKKEDHVLVEFARKIKKEKIQEYISNVRVVEKGTNTYELVSTADKDIRTDIFKFAVEQNNPIMALSKSTTSVEEVFQQLTTKKESND